MDGEDALSITTMMNEVSVLGPIIMLMKVMKTIVSSWQDSNAILACFVFHVQIIKVGRGD